jgi:intracellular sulfur oxidation DsrE/DsrF family protein
LFVAVLSVTAATPALAAGEKDRKVVLQVSDDSPEKQALVLNVANNLQQFYGLDGVKIEVVAFGPGLKLLFKDNANTARVDSLLKTGVRFSACENTTKTMTKQLGYAPELNRQAVPVTAGIARIMELTEQGYTLVRP